MGSFLDYTKDSENRPLVRLVVEHNRHFNLACEQRWARRPLYLKILFALGVRKPSYRWEHNQSLKG